MATITSMAMQNFRMAELGARYNTQLNEAYKQQNKYNINNNAQSYNKF